MTESIALVVAGLGLFLSGFEIFSDDLKLAVGDSFRSVVTRLTRNRLAGLVGGSLLGAVMPNGAGLPFVVVGLMRSGAITAANAIPLLIGNNASDCVIVLLVSFDLEIPVLFAVGLVGVLRCAVPGKQFKPVLGAALGIAMFFLGLTFIKAAAVGVAELQWVNNLLGGSAEHYLIGFGLALALSFALQSSETVSILAVLLAATSLVDLGQAVMMVYGANCGSGLSMLVLMLITRLRGSERQIAYFQVIYNLLGGAFVVPLFYLELHTQIPMVLALVTSLAASSGAQVALAFLIFNLVPGLIILSFLHSAARSLELLVPSWSLEFSGDRRRGELAHLAANTSSDHRGFE